MLFLLWGECFKSLEIVCLMVKLGYTTKVIRVIHGDILQGGIARLFLAILVVLGMLCMG